MQYISRIIEMKGPTMNLSALGELLETAPADLPVVYFTDSSAIGAGYHLTELKAAQVSSIDCGGNVDHFPEVTMQLLDGQCGRHMNVQKLSRILQHSLKELPELNSSEVKVEYSPNNEGLQVFSLGEPDITDFEVRVPLIQMGAVCKPALAAGASCGPSTCKTQSTCC